MSAAAVTSAATSDGVTAKDHAALIAEHFRQYNEEFGRITRRAALNFLAEDWHSAQLDAVARIELYEQRVARCVASIASQLRSNRTEVAVWIDLLLVMPGVYIITARLLSPSRVPRLATVGWVVALVYSFLNLYPVKSLSGH